MSRIIPKLNEMINNAEAELLARAKESEIPEFERGKLVGRIEALQGLKGELTVGKSESEQD